MPIKGILLLIGIFTGKPIVKGKCFRQRVIPVLLFFSTNIVNFVEIQYIITYSMISFNMD